MTSLSLIVYTISILMYTIDYGELKVTRFCGSDAGLGEGVLLLRGEVFCGRIEFLSRRCWIRNSRSSCCNCRLYLVSCSLRFQCRRSLIDALLRLTEGSGSSSGFNGRFLQDLWSEVAPSSRWPKPLNSLNLPKLATKPLFVLCFTAVCSGIAS